MISQLMKYKIKKIIVCVCVCEFFMNVYKKLLRLEVKSDSAIFFFIDGFMVISLT